MEEFILNLNIGIAGFIISTLGLMQVLISPHFEQWTKKLFIAFFSIMVAIAVFNLSGQIMSMYSDLAHARIFRFTLFWESLLSSLLMLLLTVFLLRSSGETDWKESKLFRIVAALWIVYVGLLIYTQFSTVIYSIDVKNVYRRGPLYPLLLVPPVLIMAVNIIALWRMRNQLSAKQRLAFGIYNTIPMISMLLQMFFYGIYTILLGSSIATVFMFNYIWLDQSERYYQQVRENEQLRIDIMLSQIQPHFLYNTLGAIQSLCKTDSGAAEKAVAKFSRYLRGNMDSISKDRTVSFTQELEHTKLYLELEQLRYEDALQVSYDLICTEFRIPTLTLQPLAENAVRHGVRGKPSGRGTRCDFIL
ncbi:MAG: histidine kinase [Oscillospiraceae bacterium]|nr:histidine kinase [Oscillospiraceae bacterium]